MANTEPTLHTLLLRSSRTFAVGIDLLPKLLRREITVAYLLFRVSDYLEDNEELTDKSKIKLLQEWRSVLAGDVERGPLIQRLAGAVDDTPDAFVARHLSVVLDGLDAMDPAAQEIAIRYARKTAAGMARWTERGSVFHTEADLDDYMHEVAGRVGWLVTELFALRVPQLKKKAEYLHGLAAEFGLLLQTVNVIRGLHEDRHRGWYYLPTSFIPEDGPPPEEIFEPENHEAAMAVLHRLVSKATGHRCAAQAYIRAIPRRCHSIRLSCLLPLMFAVRTLALSRDNPNVLHEETKMTRREVLRITASAKVLGYSNWWIDWYCHRLDTRGLG